MQQRGWQRFAIPFSLPKPFTRFDLELLIRSLIDHAHQVSDSDVPAA